jgi:hypothetical protein
MNKKLLLVAFACLATAFTTNAFAIGPCDTSATILFNGVGSSAQFNTMAYAAQDVIAHEAAPNNAHYHLFSTKGNNGGGNPSATIMDVRPGLGLPLDSVSLFVMYDDGDGAGNCNVFAYWNIDSIVGDRSFFAANAVVIGANTYSTAGVQGCLPGQGGLCPTPGPTLAAAGGPGSQNIVGALPDTEVPDLLPATVNLAMSTFIAPTGVNKPADYCGQKYAAGNKLAFYCFFNAAGTDIRPEDGFYQTNRILANPAAGLTGFDYSNANCIAAGVSCGIYDSFGKKSRSNPLKFNLTAHDPYSTTASVPGYTSFDVGAAPLLVEVSNSDTSTGGFGSTYTDDNNQTTYFFNDILHKKLAFVYEGTSHCTGDILPGAAVPCEAGVVDIHGNSLPYGCGLGSGKPIQAVLREPLSGTYTAWEFTAVRTLSGSANPAISKATSTSWYSDDDSSQEFWALEPGNTTTTPFIDPGNTALGWTAGALAAACGGPIAGGAASAAPTGTQNCSDPMFIQSGSHGCGVGLRLRANGTGQEVPAGLGLSNSGGSVVVNGTGYSFWSYGNFAPAFNSGTAANKWCAVGAYCGHYLTVDAVDPLFATEGGYGYGNGSGGYTVERNDGQPAFTFPNCNLAAVATGTPCPTKIPFTHIYDGKYPLWNVLRIVSFSQKGLTTQITPPYVLDMIAYDEIEVNSAARNTSDFVPYLKNLQNSGSIAAPVWKGDLNLGVFRVHSKLAGDPVNPQNGHTACAGNFTAVALAGGTTTSHNCLLDLGNDVGGTVMTVQDDVDFALDFGGAVVEGVTLPATYEEFGMHQ